MTAMQTVIFLIALWSIAVAAIAFFSHRTLGASDRPVDWIPFFIGGPFIALLILCVVAISLLVLVVVALVSLIVYPFGSVLSATQEGLVLTRRLSANQKTLCWSEIGEIVETEEYVGSTAVVVLKGGLRIHLRQLDAPIRTAIVDNGVPLRFVPIEELKTG